MLNKFFRKGKKAQVGEILEDIFSLLVIALLLVVLFLVAMLLQKHGLTLKSEQVSSRILNDKAELMLNSIMREKQGDNKIFSDQIRIRDENAKKALDQKINLIKNQVENYGFHLDVIYNNANEECAKTPERLTKNSCFFIPNNPIAIKMISVWGYKT